MYLFGPEINQLTEPYFSFINSRTCFLQPPYQDVHLIGVFSPCLALLSEVVRVTTENRKIYYCFESDSLLIVLRNAAE